MHKLFIIDTIIIIKCFKLNGNNGYLEFIIIYYLGFSDNNNKRGIFQRLFYFVQWK